MIRVFVNSTFTDFKHERDALHQNVFRNLELHGETRGFQFLAIDLRWGVPMAAALDNRTMQICFEERRCGRQSSPQPNFVILLGNRYGWRPLPEVISAEEIGRQLTIAIDNHNDYRGQSVTTAPSYARPSVGDRGGVLDRGDRRHPVQQRQQGPARRLRLGQTRLVLCQFRRRGSRIFALACSHEHFQRPHPKIQN